MWLLHDVIQYGCVGHIGCAVGDVVFITCSMQTPTPYPAGGIGAMGAVR